MSSGSISAMISSLKNNKISKRETKLGHLEYMKGVPIGKPLHYKNKMSKAQIDSLRAHLVKEKRKSTRRIIIIYAISVFLVACIAFYYY